MDSYQDAMEACQQSLEQEYTEFADNKGKESRSISPYTTPTIALISTTISSFGCSRAFAFKLIINASKELEQA